MMTGMLRATLVVLSVLSLSVACRRMEAMDLEGPPDGNDSMIDPSAQQAGTNPTTPTNGQQPASDGQPASDATSKPGGTSSTSTQPTPRRPPRQPTGNQSKPGGNPEGGRLAGITAAHNAVREKLGIAPLVWDANVAKYAQAWADKLKAKGCDLQHRPRKGPDAQKYGENIFAAMGSTPSAREVVDEWVAEVKDYNAKTNKCSGVCGHYTQVVWRNSQKLGCGMASCGGAEVWVCNYDPPGNFLGQRPY